MNFLNVILFGLMSTATFGVQWVIVEPEGTPLQNQGDKTQTEGVVDGRACQIYCETIRDQRGTVCDSVLYCPNTGNGNPTCTTFGPLKVTKDDPKASANQKCTSMYHIPDLTIGEEVQNNVEEFGGLYAAGVIGGSIIGGLVCLGLSYKAYKSDFLYGRTKSWWNRDSW